MGSLSSLDVVYVALIFIVPGFLIKAVRSQFVIEQDRTGADQFVRLLTYSAINNAVFGWIIYLAISYETTYNIRILLWTLLLLLAPIIIGFISGIASQKEWLYRLLRRAKLKPIHTVPNAWDYKFAHAGGEWVVVVLKNDTIFRGWWGGASFASSDTKERDILVEQIFDADDDGKWTRTDKSVLITCGEIRSIEFTPHKEPEDGE
ncbi:hypothetical protein FV222_08880 [Methylobacterium sp. WL103]|uniref:DUF6338 family protein n=1 Tax=Methylobacterium sp. WL103 TaxID=2603891 RepID=UPI0011CAFDDE|nr:DUF6338 family protein [Methylobacterium sp. WL103]TXN03065.1 hypothetical protein FV222_08880 [Methylobacterium sp. WL103]